MSEILDERVKRFLSMKGDPSIRPLYDVDALTEAVKTAVATGDPDPHPPHFCYINSSGQVVQVTTATGEEEVIDDTTKPKTEGLEIILPKSGKRVVITPETYEKMLDRLKPCETCGDAVAEDPDAELRDGYRDIGDQLLTLSQAMPNDCIFSADDGAELNPDYIAISADGSFWMILGNYIYPVEIDHGIARYDEDKCMRIIDQDEDNAKIAPLSRRLVYWNYAMMASDMSGWVITGYRKVYGAVYTKKDLRARRAEARRERRKTMSRIFAKGAVALEDLAKKFYNPFD